MRKCFPTPKHTWAVSAKGTFEHVQNAQIQINESTLSNQGLCPLLIDSIVSNDNREDPEKTAGIHMLICVVRHKSAYVFAQSFQDIIVRHKSAYVFAQSFQGLLCCHWIL